MWPPPSDAGTVTRMRAAHDRASAALRVTNDLAGPGEAWGFAGRTLGQPVTMLHKPGWLRVAAAEIGTRAATFWDGGRAAQQILPASIPRPQLRAIHDDAHDGWEYRAELYDRAAAGSLADSLAPHRLAAAPTAGWFSALRAAFDTLATVPTTRRTVEQAYLDEAMPRLLGEPITTASPEPWATAHGDLHWANLCGPTLSLLDWEGWGLAPAGYDAATLYCHSLLMPAVAARVRAQFTATLTTEAGRYAELVVIAELLDAADQGAGRDLAGPLRARAAHLLGRPVPGQHERENYRSGRFLFS